MRKLPNKLKQIIKKKRFSLNSISNESDWRGGLSIDYRITMVKAREEEVYEYLTPLNNKWGYNHINIKVKGMVEMRATYSGSKRLVEIGKATKTTENYWGGYDSKYDALWGNQVNKKVRKEIRSKAQTQINNFLKLLGITNGSWDGGVRIKTISWE